VPLGGEREKVVYGLARARGTKHRYTVRRWIVGVVATAAIAALPALGILRFDLWGGRHVLLGRELGLVEVAKGFAFPFLAINVLIILASRFLGRYLCGFGCPYGALARLAEWMHFRAKGRGQRALAAGVLALICGVLASIVFWFWIDWRVFREGSPLARGLSAAFLLGTWGAFYLALRRLGLAFCRDWCPSGVYFALLGHDTMNGVEFAHPDACTDCKACEKSCPVDLSPREMVGGRVRGSSGLYGEGLSNFALCIRCGDCVAVCEATTARSDDPVPLRMGWLDEEARTGEPDPETAEAGR